MKKLSKAEKKSKPKGQITKTILPPSPIKDYEAPSFNVVTKIVADDPMFIPQYATEGSANCDLVANIPPDGNGLRQVTIVHRGTALVDCGFSMEIKPGYKTEVMARSGWACKGMMVANSPGQIDSDYRGRVKVICINVGKEIIVIKHGDKIAQMGIMPVWRTSWEVVSTLSTTARGAGGFGSTGGM